MHLLNKRILFLTSDDSLTTDENTRGNLWIPIPQQFQDPAATDLVYKMYIQSLTIQNDFVNVDDSNNIVSISAQFTRSDGTVVPLYQNKELVIPEHSMDEATLVEFLNQMYGGNFNTFPNGPGSSLGSFTVEFTSVARERAKGGALGFANPGITANGFNVVDKDGQDTSGYQRTVTSAPVLPHGNQLFLIVYNVKNKDGYDYPLDRTDIAPTARVLYRELKTLQFKFDYAGRAGTLLGFPDAGPYTLVPFNCVAHPTPESFEYNLAREAAASPEPMLLNDFTELHVKTDLPVSNFEIRPDEGLVQTRTTTVIPVGPYGSTINYIDNDGIYAAYERNQSTVTRLHIYLEDKYGRELRPKTAWTFSLAIETHQDDFKRMIDILLASKSFHESALAMHKLQLVGSSFTALE